MSISLTFLLCDYNASNTSIENHNNDNSLQLQSGLLPCGHQHNTTSEPHQTTLQPDPEKLINPYNTLNDNPPKHVSPHNLQNAPPSRYPLGSSPHTRLFPSATTKGFRRNRKSLPGLRRCSQRRTVVT